jgi:hypothetical protein
MYIPAQNRQIAARLCTGYILPEGLIAYRKINGLHPVLKRMTHTNRFNPLFPVDILEKKWNKWNEPDEIAYTSLSGIKYVIYDDNLLADITEFMQQRGQKGTLPYLHIEGEDSWECYRRPAKKQILEFIRAYLSNYDICSTNGELVQEANSERREYTLCAGLD